MLDEHFADFEAELRRALSQLSAQLREAMPALRLRIEVSSNAMFPFRLAATFDQQPPSREIVLSVDVWTSDVASNEPPFTASRTKLEADIACEDAILLEGPSVLDARPLRQLVDELTAWRSAVLDFVRAAGPHLRAASSS